MSKETIQYKINAINDETEFEGISNQEVAEVFSLLNEEKASSQELGAVSSGFMGGISPSSPIPEHGWVKGIYVAESSGIYVNSGGITVDLNDGFTILLFDGSAWSSFVLPIDANGIIPDWIAQEYVQKSLVLYDNSIWRVADGKTATIADIPGVSDKWVLMSDINKWRLQKASKFEEYFNQDIWNNGYISQDGKNIIPNIAWQTSNAIKIDAGVTIFAKLRGDSGFIMVGKYSSPDISSFNSSLKNHGGKPGGILQVANSEFTWTADVNCYLRFVNRNYEYTVNDLFIKVENGVPKDTYTSAQELYDLIKADSVDVTEMTKLTVERPKYAEIYFTGILPTDTSNARTPTDLAWEMKLNGRSIISANCKLSIQGHASANLPKKGYTFDIINSKNKALDIKFGDMISADSFHLKAFMTDTTHSRDIGNGRLWRALINTLPYPYDKVNNIQYTASKTRDKNAEFISDAKYFPDGFPVAIYLNGNFEGLYTLRNKKTRENYALNNKDLKHIYLDSILYTINFNQAFDSTEWEIKSPKMTGYAEGGNIPPAYSTVQASIDNFFNFTRTLTTSYSNHENFIILKHWLIFSIFAETVWHRDSEVNNVNIITWDGARFSIIPYDSDNSLGHDAWDNYTIKTNITTPAMSGSFWMNFKSIYNSQLKELYTSLRRSGFLQASHLIKFYKEQVENIPRNIYAEDKAKWGSVWNNDYPNIEQIELFLNNRIDWLDSQWLNP